MAKAKATSSSQRVYTLLFHGPSATAFGHYGVFRSLARAKELAAMELAEAGLDPNVRMIIVSERLLNFPDPESEYLQWFEADQAWTRINPYQGDE